MLVVTAVSLAGGCRDTPPEVEARAPSPRELEARLRASLERTQQRIEHIAVTRERVVPRDRARLDELRDQLKNVRDRYERLLEKALRHDPETSTASLDRAAASLDAESDKLYAEARLLMGG